MQQIHSLAVTVPTNNDVSDVVDDAAQFKSSGFTGEVFVLKELTVWHEIPSVSYHEHVTDVSVPEKKKFLETFKSSML